MHNRREIPWLNVIRFHKEVTRRAEEAFFALPAGKADSNRWSSLAGFEPWHLAGPWVVNEKALVSAPMVRSIRREDTEELFLGGPCWFRWRRNGKNWEVEWLPVIYRQVRISLNGEGELEIVPDQGNWEVSPLVYSLLDRANVVLEKPLEELFPAFVEKAESVRRGTGDRLTNVLTEILAQELPELGDHLLQDFPTNKVSPKPSPWILFTPPTSTSAIHHHLMRDFEKLEQRFQDPEADVGGLELLEDIGDPEPRPTASVLPIVPLDEWQHGAVAGILQGRPVTVISGPPGTGKSQVVVSSLLNAWAQGTSVLFASNNNQAVDVVRERVEHFENEFPIAVRAGSRKASNLEEALRRTLNVIASAGQGRRERKDRRGVQQDELLHEKQQIRSFLDSKLPRRLNEALRSALNAYATYEQAVADLDSSDQSVRDALEALGYTVQAESFAEVVLGPFSDWIDGIAEASKQLSHAREERQRLRMVRDDALSARDRAAQRSGLDPSTIHSWEWLRSGPGPELLTAWLDGYRKLLAEPLERELEPFEWQESFNRWDTSSGASQWATAAGDLALSIVQTCDRLEPLTRRLEAAQAELERQKAVIHGLGVPEKVDVDAEQLASWSATYSEYCTLPQTFLSRLPWSPWSRAGRELSRVEKRLRGAFPISLWQRIGRLDDQGRSEFGEVVEQTVTWLDARSQWETRQQETRQVEQSLADLRAAARDLDLRPTPDHEVLATWRSFGEIVSRTAEVAETAATAWRKREKREEVRDRLRDAANRYQSTGSGIPLKEAWATGAGAAFDRAVLKLGADPGPSDVIAARSALYSEPFADLLEAWSDAREADAAARETGMALKRVATDEAIARAWWGSRPEAIVGEYGPETELPSEGNPLFEHLKECQSWEREWRTFTRETRPEKKAVVAKEREWAREKLGQAAEQVPDGSAGTTIRQLVAEVLAGYQGAWPTVDLVQAFGEFNPDRLEARTEQIDQELEALAFELAKDEWVSKLADDPEVQENLSALLKRYKASNNRIREEDYELFRKVLRAVPIWITTALSPQALPLQPGLFDLLIIDEATQCTLTNLLPLVYRAKRLAVIGDPEQLPAIPTLTAGAEQALARAHEIEQWLNLLGHADNDVYRTAVQCLPRRYSDVIDLLDHYRSHPLIIGFANQHVYQRRLRLRKEPGKGALVPRGPGLHGVNVFGACERGDRGRSWRNRQEAEKVLEVVRELRADDRFTNFTIGVVSPFRPQVELIEELLDAEGISRGVAVGTAHRYQGDERDVMIFTPVVAKGITENAARWVENPRNLINVAITRAREALFFVADYGACRRQPGILGKLTTYIEDVAKLRETSMEELDLFSWMVVQGWSPEVHPVVGDIEVDFVLRDAGLRLAIEVDGIQHENSKAQDAARDAFLQARGYEVLRFPARSVRETPTSVIYTIEERLRATKESDVRSGTDSDSPVHEADA